MEVAVQVAHEREGARVPVELRRLWLAAPCTLIEQKRWRINHPIL